MSTISGNNYTYLAADIVNSVGQLIIRTPTATSADILPTATSLITLFTGSDIAANVGQSLTFSIYNDSSFNISVSSNTGITFVSVVSDVIFPNAVRTYTVVQTAVSTALVYIIGNSPANPAVDTTLYLDNNKIYVGGSNNVAVGVAMSGDVNIVASGATSLVATSNSTLTSLSSLATVGTITAGTWQGTIISPSFGGTGISNGTRTITIGGGDFSTTTATAIGSTATPNQLFFTNSANSLSGLATANSAILVTGSTGVPSWSSTLTNGQIIIGSTGSTPVTGSITPGFGHVVTNGAGTITISNMFATAASTTSLTITYSNGTAGVGATLTNAGAQAAFVIDGYTTAVNDRILIKDQASSFQNGVYTVTNIGSVSTNWVLTRATDYDSITEMSQGLNIAVINGTTNSGRSFTQTSRVLVIGTDPISFITGGTGAITALTGDVTAAGPGSVAATLATVNSNVGSFTLSNITVNAKGLVTAASSTSIVPLANGGTNANLTASNGGIFYSTATAGAILAGTATANRVLLSGASTVPSWSTAVYPATTTINQLLYSSAANTITGLAAANSAILVTGSTGVPVWSSTLTNGQIIIGSTGATPVAGSITTIYGHVITSGAGTISISNQYVNAASTVALTVTYANGTAGVGATLTNAGAQAAFSIDGVAGVLNSTRVLIKDQVSSPQNGIYLLTTLGSGATNWVLTRTTDYNTITQMSQGLSVAVLSGTVNAGRSFTQTTVVTAIGTSGISFADQSIVTSGITALTGDVTATGPGSAVATLATVNSNVGTFTNPSVTVNAKGLVTAISNGIPFQNVFYAYGPTASISVPGTPATPYTTLTSYQTPSFTAGAYTYSAGFVTVLVTGLYEVCYTMQFNGNGGTGSQTAALQSQIIRNGTSLAGSITETSLIRLNGVTNRSFNSKSWIVSITANDTLAIQYAQNTTTTPFQVTQNQCTFTIKRIQ